MDKNTITGFVLIALILFGFAWWQHPSEEQSDLWKSADVSA